MKSVLLNKCREEYVKLNKQFLENVENGTPWEQLQPLIEEMKSLAIYLQQIPTDTDTIIHTKHTASETSELEETI